MEPPCADNRDVNKQDRHQSDPEKQNGELHMYQNTGSVHSVTVVADVHRERTRPRSSNKRKPMKLPRKSKPLDHMQPIYENQVMENGSPSPPANGQAAFENVTYSNTT